MTAIDAFVDYYKVLGVPRTAAPEQVEAAIKRELQRWTKATSHPSLTKRQEAEQQVKNISEARHTLLDERRRSRYDEDWTGNSTRAAERSSAEAQGAGGERDWVALAQKYLAENDYSSAAYAVREATQRHGDNAETWSLRAQANLGLGRLDEAVYEARQATEIEPTDSGYHYSLAQVQEASGRWDAAMASYESVARLEPANPAGKLGVATVLLRLERPADARRITEQLRRRFPGDRTVGVYHGWALAGIAERVPRVRDSDSYSVTSEAELLEMRGLLEQARAATDNGEVREEIRRIDGYLDKVARRTLHVPFGTTTGYVVSVFFAAMLGLGSLFSGSGGGFLFGLLCVLAVAAAVAAAWVPGWKVNDRAARAGR